MAPGSDRREHDRTAVKIPFFCYVDGQRFDTDAMDLSPGGAFLRTEDDVRISAPVLMLPKIAKTKKPAILVVGHIVRRKRESPKGLGIRWRKVVSRGGVSLILKLVNLVPDMFPDDVPAPTREFAEAAVVGYSFKDNAYFMAKLPGSSTGGRKRAAPASPSQQGHRPPPPKADKPALHMDPPKSHSHRVETHHDLKSPTSYWGLDGEATKVVPEERVRGPNPTPARQREAKVEPTAQPSKEAAPSIASPGTFKRAAGIGPLTEALAYEQAQIPVSIKVRVNWGGKKQIGVLLRVGMSDCFVACPDAFAGDISADDPVEVRLTIDLHSRTHEVNLCCRLIVFGLDPITNREGLALSIRAVEQPASPGLFERYVKYLYYHMINEA